MHPLPSDTFHVLTDELTMVKYPVFKAEGLGAFPFRSLAWNTRPAFARLASFRLLHAATLAEAYTHDEGPGFRPAPVVGNMLRPSMVPAGVVWCSTGA